MSGSMNTPSNAVPGSPFDAQTISPPAMSPTRPFYWSVRRELWENRFVYIAPLAVAGVVMLATLISLIWLPHTMRTGSAHTPAHAPTVMAMPYSHASILLLLTGFVVGIFYSLDALHGERRDRSILFWKSLPVSDLTTVLSKASIPLVVLPVLVWVIVVAIHLIILPASILVLLLRGGSAATLWAELPFFQLELVLLYTLIVVTLWHAPIYCWFLLVSGWARRATFLWAVLPLLAIAAVEKIAFRTSYFGWLLHNRLGGFVPAAFAGKLPSGEPVDPHFIPLTQLTPGKFLSTPGLWIGLVVAAGFLAAAVRLRRYREPI